MGTCRPVIRRYSSVNSESTLAPLPVRPGVAQRHAFGQHQIQHAVLKPLAAQTRGDGLFDRLRIGAALDLL